MERKNYPSDVSDDEWAFVTPYLTLMKEDAPQREHSLREVFNSLCYMVRSGSSWRLMPHDLPPWYTVYQQTQRSLAAGVFEAIVDDLRMLLRLAAGHSEDPSAVIMDSRTMQSSPESGTRAGFDGHKSRKASKVHMVVDTLGLVLALHGTPANKLERAQVGLLGQQVQDITGDSVEIAFVDQAIPVHKPTKLLLNMAFTWKSSNCRRPSTAWSCCPDAGSSNAPFPGWPASVVWHVIMSACRRHWLVCIIWPFPFALR